jgi:ribose 5-phosphate isomerase B
MKIYLGADHRGFKLKEKLKSFLSDVGYEPIDLGNTVLDEDDDYPDFIAPVADAVSKDQESRGIILGYSGQGEAILANRFSGVRAIVYYGGPEEIIKLSREHNNANILSLGVGFLDEGLAKDMVEKWLDTSFTGDERHERRINKIEKLTKK